MCVPPVVSEALLHRHVGHVEHHIARPPRHSSVQILPVEAQQGLPSLRAAVKGPPHFLRAKFLGQCGPVSPPEIQPIWIKGQVVAHVQRLRHRARQFLTAPYHLQAVTAAGTASLLQVPILRQDRGGHGQAHQGIHLFASSVEEWGQRRRHPADRHGLEQNLARPGYHGVEQALAAKEDILDALHHLNVNGAGGIHHG